MSEELELPEGWAKAPLNEVVAFSPRHPRDLNGAMPVSFVPMAAVNESRPQLTLSQDRPLGEVRQGFTHFANGDVLFAKITPCMENGKGGVAEGLTNGIGCGTTELVVLRPQGAIDSHYLYRFLAQPSVRRDAKEHFTGTAGQARVPLPFLQELEIPLAPLDEQRRIVAKLDQVLARVDACQHRLATASVLLKRFRQSVLAAACSGQLTADWRRDNPTAEPYWADTEPPEDNGQDLPLGWRSTRLGRLTTLVTSGSRGWAKYYAPTGATFIRAQNINSDVLNLKDIAFVKPPGSAEGLRTRVRLNDLLVTITGANVAKAALVEHPIGDAYVSQHVALIRLADARVSKFLFNFIVSIAHGRKQLLEAAYGQGKPGLNLDNIKDVVVQLPPLAEQEEIGRRVDELFMLGNHVETRCGKAMSHVDKLISSVLAKAFHGELVQTEADLARREGRRYEPASVLLKRSQKERTAQPLKPRSGGRTLPRRDIRHESDDTRRQLDDVLQEHDKPLTPEQLFELAGFDDSCVDAFYEQLRELIEDGRVLENRPNKMTVYLGVARK